MAAINFFTLLDTANPNRYVECGEVFAGIPRGGPGIDRRVTGRWATNRKH
jgi:hypothetical protein